LLHNYYNIIGCHIAGDEEDGYFGQEQVPLTDEIKEILEEYPDGQIFKVCIYTLHTYVYPLLYSGFLLRGPNICDAVKITLRRNICYLNICKNFCILHKNIE